MIEAAMLVALGFLSASLLALAAIPALARRADRLARKRAEAAFPLSLAEIAADRDHLRAELALRARTLEQQAERGFAARAGAMREIGERDMAIGKRERELAARDARIGTLESELGAARGELGETREALAQESTALADAAATLDKRLADLASVEHNLAEARTALTGTGADLATRGEELKQERATLGRVEGLLEERDRELAAVRDEYDQLRVTQVESRTQFMVLEGKRDELADKLAAAERELAKTRAALQSERGRAAKEEAGLREDLRERAGRLEALHAEIQTLQGALDQARTERARLKGGAKAGKAPAEQSAANDALRQEIVRVAERVMALPPKQEAAE